LHPSTRSINHYAVVKREKPTSSRQTPSIQQPLFATELSQNRAVLYSRRFTVDGWQTAFSVNGNTVHTRQDFCRRWPL